MTAKRHHDTQGSNENYNVVTCDCIVYLDMEAANINTFRYTLFNLNWSILISLFYK